MEAFHAGMGEGGLDSASPESAIRGPVGLETAVPAGPLKFPWGGTDVGGMGLRTGWGLIALFLVLIAPRTVSAQWLLTVDAEAALPAGGYTADAFGIGASAGLGLYRPLNAFFVPGLRIRGGFLSDGEPPADPTWADPGVGTFYSATLALRFRLPTGGAERGTGLYIEGGGGLTLTGDAPRASVEAALGYNFRLGAFAVGPTVRYVHIVELDSQRALDDGDGRIVMAGLEFAILDDRNRPRSRNREDDGPSDRDFDGLIDEEDDCPDEPEDFDEFEDEDGCPDVDNDQDGILDAADGCPLIPEDIDGFEDEDGCPDEDNDRDGILDGDDACPNEAEVVNGIDDEDGCPDEGLITFVEDRVVLDDRVLFDTDLWTLRAGAYPVLEAIVNLWRQHPEWNQMRVEGHADYRGRDEWNQRLSERRAEVVATVLVRMGMPERQLDTAGFGSTQPRSNGYGTRALQRNRRVEFVVVNHREVIERTSNAEPTPTGAGDGGPSPEGTEAARQEVSPSEAGDVDGSDEGAPHARLGRPSGERP
ncbi:MAG: OmpA family protein [Myxococcota bacterium]